MYRLRSFGVVTAIMVLVSAASAEQRQDTGTSNTRLCKTLYELYDLNMEAYYSKGQTNRQRQEAYNSAQRAISDFRKNGCKHRDLAT